LNGEKNNKKNGGKTFKSVERVEGKQAASLKGRSRGLTHRQEFLTPCWQIEAKQAKGSKDQI